MGSCQNYGPFLGTLNNRCRIILGTPKETIILTTTHVLNSFGFYGASGDLVSRVASRICPNLMQIEI